MGFYGNITNGMSRSQFQFDRVYPNRQTMDEGVFSDGVFIGRYVLIDYTKEKDFDEKDLVWIWDDQENGIFQVYNKAFIKNIDTDLYDRPEYSVPTVSLTAKDCENKRVIKVDVGHHVSNIKYNNEGEIIGYDLNKIVEYRVATKSGNSFIWEAIDDYYSEDAKETENYRIDKQLYHSHKGYDSTVWQKVMSNGSIKYIPIADLNTYIPEVKLITEEPTQIPESPYFDLDSTNKFYNYHNQPQAGFRVKSANSVKTPIIKDGKITADLVGDSISAAAGKSDETILWSNTFNIDNKKITRQFSVNEATKEGNWRAASVGMPGAIYFNKAGFDRITRHYDDSTENHIKLEMTGRSGNIYAGHEEPSVDTQELSIMLPAVGNAVSTVWDLMYGEERNLACGWEDLSTGVLRLGNRLLMQDGNFNKEGISNTLTSCINSVYDLLGMIIYTFNTLDELEDAKKLLPNNFIYYVKSEGKFYRIKKSLKFGDRISKADKNTFEEYQKVKLTDLSQENNYYIMGHNVFSPQMFDLLKAPEEYSEDYKYYKINPKDIQKIGKIKYIYEPGKFYSKEKDTTKKTIAYKKIMSNSTPSIDETSYYINSSAKKKAGYIYVPDVYYYQSGGVFILDHGQNMVAGREYFINTNDPQQKIEDNYLEVPTANYLASNFDNYYIVNTNGLVSMAKDVYKSYAEAVAAGVIFYTKSQNISEISLAPVKIVKFEDGKFFTEDSATGTFQSLTVSDLKEILFKNLINNVYTLPTLDPDFVEINYFYAPYIYRYKDGNNYLVDDASAPDKTREYYDVTPVYEEGLKSYKDDYYYYYNEKDNSYHKKTGSLEETDLSLYERQFLYVVNDTREIKIFPEGMPWEFSIDEIPDEVEVRLGVFESDFEELSEFSRGLNTLHGLILRMNNMLSDNDPYTRDLNTLQGIINSYKDEIAKIRGELINNGGIEGDKQWIATSIDSETGNIIIHHAHSGKAYTAGQLETKTLSFGKDFNIRDLSYDTAGHIVGASEATYTLPGVSINGSGNLLVDVTNNGTSLVFNKGNVKDLKGFTVNNNNLDTILTNFNSQINNINTTIDNMKKLDVGMSINDLEISILFANGVNKKATYLSNAGITVTNTNYSNKIASANALASLKDTVSGLNTSVSGLNTSVSGLNTSVSNLNSALNNKLDISVFNNILSKKYFFTSLSTTQTLTKNTLFELSTFNISVTGKYFINCNIPIIPGAKDSNPTIQFFVGKKSSPPTSSQTTPPFYVYRGDYDKVVLNVENFSKILTFSSIGEYCIWIYYGAGASGHILGSTHTSEIVSSSYTLGSSGLKITDTGGAYCFGFRIGD